MEDWLTNWEAESKAARAKPEPGFYTVQEIAERLQITKSSAETRVYRLVGVGLMERRQFAIKTANGIRPVWHYKAKGKK